MDNKTLVEEVIKDLKRYKKENAIKAADFVTRFNGYRNIKVLTETNFRAIIAVIQEKSLLPVIECSKGFYICSDKKEMEQYIKGLIRQSKMLLDFASGLNKFS